MVHALEELKGVKKAYAHFPEKRAVIIYDPGLVTMDQMRQALLKAGYVANPQEHEGTPLTGCPKDLDHTEKRQKEGFVCYCFRYTENDIKQDLIKNGRSLIMEKITKEKKIGGCDCKNLNPKGR